MAITSKRLCSGAFPTSDTTLYTAPATSGNYTIVKAVTLCNKTSASVNVTLKFASIEVIASFALTGYGTITIPFMDHIISAGETLSGYADSGSAVNYYISGKEVT